MAVFRLIICATAFLAVCVELGVARHDCSLDASNGFSCDLEDLNKWGQCTVRGDPHFTTWDNVKYQFDGDCDYKLVDFCELESNEPVDTLRITADFDEREVDTSYTQVVSVTLSIDNVKFGVHKSFGAPKGGPQGFDVGGPGATSFTATAGTATVTGFSGGSPISYVMRVKVGALDLVRIQYTPKYHWLEISLDRTTYINQICGMCGTFNGNNEDDIKTKYNKPDSNPNNRRRRKRMGGSMNAQKLGSKWKVSGIACGTE